MLKNIEFPDKQVVLSAQYRTNVPGWLQRGEKKQTAKGILPPADVEKGRNGSGWRRTY